jgi:hypothetical protein
MAATQEGDETLKPSACVLKLRYKRIRAIDFAFSKEIGMNSPFPGMDPFIEAQGKWEDFHNKLMGDIERFLSQILPARYAVRLGERSYIDYLDPKLELAGKLFFKPDVGIKSSDLEESSLALLTSVLEGRALDMEGLVEAEYREVFLEIHELDPELRLVTGIEVLSPANKRPGTVGWYQYERKRKVFLEGHANLVEIDLFRGGRRHAMTEPWPDSPYYLLVLRKALAPRCKVRPAHYREPITDLPIPLAHADPDVPLPLQSLINGIFARSRYGREIDYGVALKSPLPDADAIWLHERIQE